MSTDDESGIFDYRRDDAAIREELVYRAKFVRGSHPGSTRKEMRADVQREASGYAYRAWRYVGAGQIESRIFMTIRELMP